MFALFFQKHFECQKGIKLTNCTRKFFLIRFSNFPLTGKDMKKTGKKKMSCHNGYIPARQEFVLWQRTVPIEEPRSANGRLGLG